MSANNYAPNDKNLRKAEARISLIDLPVQSSNPFITSIYKNEQYDLPDEIYSLYLLCLTIRPFEKQ